MQGTNVGHAFLRGLKNRGYIMTMNRFCFWCLYLWTFWTKTLMQQTRLGPIAFAFPKLRLLNSFEINVLKNIQNGKYIHSTNQISQCGLTRNRFFLYLWLQHQFMRPVKSVRCMNSKQKTNKKRYKHLIYTFNTPNSYEEQISPTNLKAILQPSLY